MLSTDQLLAIDRNANMLRAAIVTSTLAIALSLVGCRGSPPATPVPSPDSEPPVDIRSAAPAYEVHAIALDGDGRSVPVELAPALTRQFGCESAGEKRPDGVRDRLDRLGFQGVRLAHPHSATSRIELSILEMLLSVLGARSPE